MSLAAEFITDWMEDSVSRNEWRSDL